MDMSYTGLEGHFLSARDIDILGLRRTPYFYVDHPVYECENMEYIIRLDGYVMAEFVKENTSDRRTPSQKPQKKAHRFLRKDGHNQDTFDAL